MLFWTVVFITMSLLYLVRGKSFYSSIIKSGELTLEKSQENISESRKKELDQEILLTGLPLLLVNLPLAIAKLVYFFKAVNVDIYKYPTLIMIAIVVIGFVIGFSNNKNNNDLSTEEKRFNYKSKLYQKRTGWGVVNSLISLSYFGYMFYVLALM
jgi:hypothetical protein